ncbi:MAG: GAF domain-containing protein [Chloroflexota bacterium]
MTQTPDTTSDYSQSRLKSINHLDRLVVASVVLCLITGLLGWSMSQQTLFHAGSIDRVVLGVGVGFYVLLYASLALLSFRTNFGLYAGFHTIAVIGAYLMFGPLAALITVLLGNLLSEAGRLLFHDYLGLTSYTVREAGTDLLFYMSAHGLTTLLGGLVYAWLGGPLPLTSVGQYLIVPIGGMFAVNVIVYQLLLAARVRWLGGTLQQFQASFPALLFGQAFSLPIAMLMPIIYYNVKISAFLLLAIVTVLAAILFRVSERSRGALERRIVEMATLNSIGQSLATRLDMPDLMQGIYEQVMRLLEVDLFYIALYVPDMEAVTFPFVMEKGRRVQWETRQNANGLSEYIMSTGKVLSLTGVLKEEAGKLGLDYLEGQAVSYLGAPLGAGDEVMGVLALQSQRPNAYRRAEVQLLLTMVAQITIALRNATLYNRVWEMADELALLNNVSSVVTATLDLDIVLKTTCAIVTQVGRAGKTGIFLISEDGTKLRLVHSIGLSDDYVAQFQDIPRDSNSGPTQVLNRASAMPIPDVRTDPLAIGWRSLAEVEGYIGLLTVPLIASERVIGFLAAFYAEPHMFGKSELDLMNTLANQVAVTVANARLYRDTQVRAQAMSRLVDASRTFTASLDLSSVAQTVLDELQGVLAADRIVLFLVGTHGDLNILAQRGTEALAIPTPMTSDRTIAQAIAARTPMSLPNERAENHADNTGNEALLQQFESESLYILPLVSQDKVIGIVLAGHKTRPTFSDRERQLTEALVNQAATAIRNAQLYGQTDAALADRVSELSAIEAISREISGSLDLASIIDNVLDTAIRVTQADLAGCALVSSETMLRYVERDPQGSTLTPLNESRDRESGIIGRVMATGKIAHIDDIQVASDAYSGSLSNARSVLCVPILRQQERVGVLILESRQVGAFTAVHEQFMVNLAEHAALAISNVRLFEEREAQIDMLIKFRKLSLDLLSANSLREVMDHIVSAALTIAHAKDVHLYLYDRDSDTLTFGASLWLDGRQNVEASKPSRYGDTWQVAATGEKNLLENVALLHHQLQFNPGMGYGAIARIPLLRSGQVIGVLNIAFEEAHDFTASETRAFDLLANQAAIVIENTRLFDEVRVSRDRMQAILDSTRDGVILLGYGGELILANPPAERLLNFPLRNHMGDNLLHLVAKLHRSKDVSDSLTSLFKTVHNILVNLAKSSDEITRHTFQMEIEGIVRDIESMVLPVQRNTGVASGRLVVLRDVSEEKSLDRFREDMTNMIVHDLRAPLTGVITSLRMIDDMVTTNDFSGIDQVISIAISSSENQMRMIESMLEIDKLETGHVQLHKELIPIAGLVRKAMLSLDVVASAAHVQIVNCVPGDFPSLEMDEELIRRVLVNLMDNALRYTPTNGEVRIEAWIDEDHNFARIGVLDSGKGIPPDFRERVFEKFVQIQKSALRGQRGLGLGLTFCKLAIEAHGGRIWVDSSPMGGAAFWFTLLLKPDPEV